jgi:DNA-binding transcriptional regulator YiaG
MMGNTKQLYVFACVRSTQAVFSMTPTDLRTARKELGLTQAGLAAKLGVTSTAVAYWERGERPMPEWMALVLRGIKAEREVQA